MEIVDSLQKDLKDFTKEVKEIEMLIKKHEMEYDKRIASRQSIASDYPHQLFDYYNKISLLEERIFYIEMLLRRFG